MNYFDILLQMKTGQKVPYSKDYFDTLFAAKLAEMQIKTLTGTLPLTFRTSETALRSWTIYGNNTQHNYSADHTLPLTFSTNTAGNADDWSISGNDNVGKNLLKITGTTVEDHGVKFTINPIAGTVIANGTATNGQGRYAFYINLSETQNVYLSGCPEGGSSSTYNLYPWDLTAGARPKKWDGTTAQSDSDYGTSALEVQALAGHNVSCTIRIEQGYTANNLVFKPMYRLADTSADFEPYQVGVGQRTVNLFDATIVQGSYNNNTGEAEPSDTRVRTDAPITLDADSTYTINATGVNNVLIRRYNLDGTFNTSLGAFYLPATFNTATNTQYKYNFVFRNYATETDITPSDVTDIMLVKGSTAPSSYVPYGYEIPLSVNNTPQTFYIGDTPLTAGQSISKTSTGVDISAVQGTNSITTDLYNKPEMSIEGVDYVGVGEKSGNSWQIPLTVSDGTSTTSVNVPIDAPLTEGESVTDTLTISTFEGENTLDTTMTNKPQMSKTYKGG